MVVLEAMSTCSGDISVSTKTDKSMQEYVDAEAERLGVTRAEFIRRVLELYRESRNDQTECPDCGETVRMDVKA